MNARTTFPVILVLGALLAGCGSTSAATDSLVGTYDYVESNTFTITGASASAGTATGTLTVAASGTDYLVTIDTAGDAGGGPCTLSATAPTATSLVFPSGQTCAVSAMGATGTATLTSGLAELSGATLTLDLAYDVSGTSPMGAFTATTVDDDTATRR